MANQRFLSRIEALRAALSGADSEADDSFSKVFQDFVTLSTAPRK